MSVSINLISIVIPVYNSEECLPLLISRLRPVMSRLAVASEVILVNDGSGDRSWAVIQELATLHPWIVGIDLMRNFGQQNALLCGIRAARGDIVITMDDDLQNPPEEIPSLIAKLADGYDVVYGIPAKRQHGFLRGWAADCAKILLPKLTGNVVSGQACDFRVFWTRLRDHFPAILGSRFSLDALLSWCASRFGVVEVRQDRRYAGSSNYSLFRLMRHFVNMLTGFSARPLHLTSVMGLLVGFAGIIALLMCIGWLPIGARQVGKWTTLGALLLISSGVQLLAIGILGEYLSRLHFSALGRPDYVIRSISQSGKPLSATGAKAASDEHSSLWVREA